MPEQRDSYKRRKPPAGIPVSPKSVGKKEEAPCGDTCMPKESGQEGGSPLRGYLYAQREWARRRER